MKLATRNDVIWMLGLLCAAAIWIVAPGTAGAGSTETRLRVDGGGMFRGPQLALHVLEAGEGVEAPSQVVVFGHKRDDYLSFELRVDDPASAFDASYRLGDPTAESGASQASAALDGIAYVSRSGWVTLARRGGAVDGEFEVELAPVETSDGGAPLRVSGTLAGSAALQCHVLAHAGAPDDAAGAGDEGGGRPDSGDPHWRLDAEQESPFCRSVREQALD